MSRWMMRSGVLLTLFAVLWACEGDPLPQEIAGPRAELVTSSAGAEYKLIEGRIPSAAPELQVSRLIGTDGGRLSLAGHTLRVPAGAVSEPTLFTMTLATNGYVEVDLKATRLDVLGNVIDIGAQGFPKGAQPTLTLTYAWASNVETPTDLLILWMENDSHDGPHQPLPSTVDAAGKTVTTTLSHFSGYCMAEG